MQKSIRQHKTNQPSPKSKQIDFDDKGNACYFYIADEGEELDDDTQASMAFKELRNGFDKLLVQSVNEVHAESKDIKNVLSDTFIAFSMGAKPVRVEIQAQLYSTREEDHFLDFLYSYHNKLRGTRLSVDRLIVYFIYMDEYMILKIRGITPTKATNREDMVAVQLSCIGYNMGRFAPGKIEDRKGIVESNERAVSNADLEAYNNAMAYNDSADGGPIEDVSLVNYEDDTYLSENYVDLDS